MALAPLHYMPRCHISDAEVPAATGRLRWFGRTTTPGRRDLHERRWSAALDSGVGRNRGRERAGDEIKVVRAKRQQRKCRRGLARFFRTLL